MAIKVNYPTNNQQLKDVREVLKAAGIEEGLRGKPVLIVGSNPYSFGNWRIHKAIDSNWVLLTDKFSWQGKRGTRPSKENIELHGTLLESGKIKVERTFDDNNPLLKNVKREIDIDSNYGAVLVDFNYIDVEMLGITKKLMGKLSLPMYYIHHSEIGCWNGQSLEEQYHENMKPNPDIASIELRSQRFADKYEGNGTPHYTTITLVKKPRTKKKRHQ